VSYLEYFNRVALRLPRKCFVVTVIIRVEKSFVFYEHAPDVQRFLMPMLPAAVAIVGVVGAVHAVSASLE